MYSILLAIVNRSEDGRQQLDDLGQHQHDEIVAGAGQLLRHCILYIDTLIKIPVLGLSIMLSENSTFESNAFSEMLHRQGTLSRSISDPLAICRANICMTG